MQKTCRWCQLGFEVTEEDRAFYAKQRVGEPSLCVECRQQRRAAFRNERKLHRRKCDRTGESMISIYAAEVPFKVYKPAVWWSDQWDPLDYGRDYDFSRTFFEQYRELQAEVPRLALYQKNVENAEFTNHTMDLKNGYLCVDVGMSEDVCYSNWIIDCRDVVDCYQMESSELCYESLYAVDNYNCVGLYLSDRNRDSAFLYDCNDCSDCYMSWNLRKKRFCIENKQYSEEEYRARMKEIDLGSYKVFEQERLKFAQHLERSGIRCDQHLVSSEDSAGDLIYQCKNVNESFEVINSQDCRYCYLTGYAVDCMDVFQSAIACERQYECHGCNRSKFVTGCSISYDCAECYYCEMCHNSRDLLGCIGLRHKQYCILNKQYSESDYRELAGKIFQQMKRDGEWGEFFPPELSPFAYNETVAMDYYPLSRVEAEARGWKWRAEDDVREAVAGAEIPDHIDDCDQSLCSKVMVCAVTGRPFKITELEFKICKKMAVPLPRKCPDQRYRERMALRNPWKLFERKCGKCAAEVRSSFAKNAPQTVYCEQCYLAEVY